MKRILGFILVFIILTQSFGVYSVIAKNADELPSYRTEAEILINLGIIKNFNMESYDPYSYITNREFLFMLNDFMGGGEISDFSSFAKQLGAIEEGENLENFLYPTYEFAMAAALGALGYNKFGVMPETGKRMWSLNQAKRMGLYDGGVNLELSLRRSDAVKLLFNMLDAPVLDLASIRIDSEGFVITPEYTTSDDGALYYYRKIYKSSGVVDATEFTAMYDESYLGAGKISVDGHEYILDDNADFDRYVGVYCDVYISKEDNLSKILSVTPSNNTKSITITADEFVAYKKNGNTKTISYSPSDKDGRNYNITLSSSAAVISNGYGLKNYTQDDFKITKGDITLYENDGDSKYDTVIINSAKTVFVDAINLSKGEIYNKFTFDTDAQTIVADANDTDTKLTISRNNEEIKLEDLAAGDILDVYFNKKADNKKRTVRIIAGGKSFRGIVQSASRNSEVIKIADKNYEVSPWYISAKKATPPDEYAPELKPGQAYVIYLDSMGKIAAAESDKYGGMSCGYVYKTMKKTEAFEEIYYIRVFSEDGEWKVYELAKSVKLDDITKKASLHFPSIEAQKGSLVLFKTNTEGKVNEIRTALDTFVLGQESENFNKSEMDTSVDSLLVFKNVSNYFEGYQSKNLLAYIGANCKIFGVSTGTGASEDDFGMVSVSSLVQDGGYTSVKAYGVDMFGIADYMVIETDDKMRTDKVKRGTVMLVKESYEMLNSDGDIVKCISGPYEFLTDYKVTFAAEAKEYDVNGKQVTTHSRIDVGDLVRFNKNAAGEVDTYTVLCRASDADKGEGYFPFSTTASLGGFMGEFRHMYGTLVKCDPDVRALMLDVRKKTTDSQILKSALISSSAKVFICEGNERYRTISMGSLRDIAKGDFVYVAAQWAVVHTIVVYKL